MVANTGTYLDVPSHRFADGPDLSGVSLAHLVDLPGLVIRLPESTTAIDRLLLAPYDVRGKAVLLHTGWDRHWGSDAYGAGGHPFLTADASEDLAARGATLVGIDSVSVDDLTDGARPAHTVLLRHGVIIVEHLRGLGALPPADSGSTPRRPWWRAGHLPGTGVRGGAPVAPFDAHERRWHSDRVLLVLADDPRPWNEIPGVSIVGIVIGLIIVWAAIRYMINRK